MMTKTNNTPTTPTQSRDDLASYTIPGVAAEASGRVIRCCFVDSVVPYYTPATVGWQDRVRAYVRGENSPGTRVLIMRGTRSRGIFVSSSKGYYHST